MTLLHRSRLLGQALRHHERRQQHLLCPERDVHARAERDLPLERRRQTGTEFPDRPVYGRVGGCLLLQSPVLGGRTQDHQRTSGTTFSPNGIVTRAQVVTMMWRAAGSPEVAADQTFTDVPANAYYAAAVRWAAANKITTGTGNNCFLPAAPCIRAQIVTLLYNQLHA